MTDLTVLQYTALHAVAETAAVARHIQHAVGGRARITKEDFSPVSVADFAVQALIALRLHESLGSLVMVGEESSSDLRAENARELRAAVVAAVREVRPELQERDVLAAIDLGEHDATGGAYWTLDPVDGTKGFLRGGQYAISLAYIESGEVRLGVLGCPNLGADFDRAFDQPAAEGTLFFAVGGGGAYSVPAGTPRATPARLRVSSRTTAADMRVCESVEAAHSRLDENQRVISHLQARGTPARLDSQCKYAVVARGQADAYIRLPTRADYEEKIWDHAAGALVAQEAGAVVTDIHGHRLDFSQGATLKRNRGVVCATPHYHPAIVDAIATLYG